MAIKHRSKRDRQRANWNHYPQAQTLDNKPGKGKAKRQEGMIFDVQLHEVGCRSKRVALIQVKAKAQSTVFTSYGEHGFMSHRSGPQIMGNRGRFQAIPKRCKRWGSK